MTICVLQNASNGADLYHRRLPRMSNVGSGGSTFGSCLTSIESPHEQGDDAVDSLPVLADNARLNGPERARLIALDN